MLHQLFALYRSAQWPSIATGAKVRELHNYSLLSKEFHADLYSWYTYVHYVRTLRTYRLELPKLLG